MSRKSIGAFCVLVAMNCSAAIHAGEAGATSASSAESKARVGQSGVPIDGGVFEG